MLTEGYFDESGSFDEAPHIFCVAGYFIKSSAAREMDIEWKKVLDKYGLEYFHMVDCAHGAELCKPLTKTQRSDVARELIDLIKKYTLHGWSILTTKKGFENKSDPYTVCASMAVTALQTFVDYHRRPGDIAYFFEAGHKSQGRTYTRIAKSLQGLGASVTFARKASVRLLQAADILAWQTTKYTKGKLIGRAQRLDCLSLFEHPHTLFYLHDAQKDRILICEEWPPSRRPKEDKHSRHNAADGTTDLIISGKMISTRIVDRTLGWADADDSAVIGFKMVRGEDLTLLFDDPRLCEAIQSFLGGMGAFKESRITPAIPARGVEIEKDGALTVVLRNGRRLKFVFPARSDIEKELAPEQTSDLSKAEAQAKD